MKRYLPSHWYHNVELISLHQIMADIIDHEYTYSASGKKNHFDFREKKPFATQAKRGVLAKKFFCPNEALLILILWYKNFFCPTIFPSVEPLRIFEYFGQIFAQIFHFLNCCRESDIADNFCLNILEVRYGAKLSIPRRKNFLLFLGPKIRPLHFLGK